MGKRRGIIAKVAVILLAAGLSRRWGEDNKLLADIGGKPMIRRTLDAILASGLAPVIVVTGHGAEAIGAAVQGLPVTIHRAENYAAGMSASLKTGISAISDNCDRALICLGDMPFVKPETFAVLANKPMQDRLAIFPTFDRQRGNPVLLSRDLFPNLLRLTGDQGARKVLAAIPERVGEIAVDDPGILRDIDQPDMLPS